MNIKETLHTLKENLDLQDLDLKNIDLKETLETVKEKLGLEPQQVEEGVYIPAGSALKLAAPKVSNYDDSNYENPYSGDKKILMVCTEQQYMTMADGKKFDTGNQPIEMMVPLLHFEKAGFAVDVFTPTGQPVKIEQWAMPHEDKKVMQIFETYKTQLEQPKSIKDFVVNEMSDSDDYAAIFIPGGHGAMLGLPEDKYLGELLRWGYENDLYTMAICHGPAALLAANLDRPEEMDSKSENESNNESTVESNSDFIFKGYDMVAFPDVMDKQMPKLGYLPGEMTWYFNEKLEGLGVTITNHLATGHTHQDRKLISGDGPLAANDFGKLAAEELLKTYQ